MLKICVWNFFRTVVTPVLADLKKWPPLPPLPPPHRPIELCLCVELHHIEDNTGASRMYTSHYIQWLPGKRYILWWRSTRKNRRRLRCSSIKVHIEIIGVSVRDIKNYTRFVMGNIIIVIQFSRPEVRRRDSRIMSVAEPPWGSASPRCTRDVGFLVRKCIGIYL